MALCWASLKRRAWRQTESRSCERQQKLLKLVFKFIIFRCSNVSIVRKWSYVCALLVKPSWLSESAHDICRHFINLSSKMVGGGGNSTFSCFGDFSNFWSKCRTNLEANSEESIGHGH